jgi:hypothetical protein
VDELASDFIFAPQYTIVVGLHFKWYAVCYLYKEGISSDIYTAAFELTKTCFSVRHCKVANRINIHPARKWDRTDLCK